MFTKSIYSIQADLCRAMGNEVRLQIVHLLRDNPLHVGEIARELNLSQPTVSRHLSTLRHAGVLTSEREIDGISYQISNRKIIQVCDLMREVLIEGITQQSQITEDSVG
jgi:DNA-binding transcriptional ArsR family regulator